MNEVQARQVILGTITKKNVVRNERRSIFRPLYLLMNVHIFHFVYDGLSQDVRFDEKLFHVL